MLPLVEYRTGMGRSYPFSVLSGRAPSIAALPGYSLPDRRRSRTVCDLPEDSKTRQPPSRENTISRIGRREGVSLISSLAPRWRLHQSTFCHVEVNRHVRLTMTVLDRLERPKSFVDGQYRSVRMRHRIRYLSRRIDSKHQGTVDRVLELEQPSEVSVFVDMVNDERRSVEL